MGYSMNLQWAIIVTFNDWKEHIEYIIKYEGLHGYSDVSFRKSRTKKYLTSTDIIGLTNVCYCQNVINSYFKLNICIGENIIAILENANSDSDHEDVAEL
jgi:hypothetical protein